MNISSTVSQSKDELQEEKDSESEKYCCSIADRKAARKHLKKQSYILAVGAVGIFTSFSGVVNLQSSVNIEKSIGTTSLAIAFATTVLLNVTLVPVLIEVCGVKSLLLASELAFFLYTVANFYPAYYTLYTGAVVLGFGEAIVWPVYYIYNCSFGVRYANTFTVHIEGCQQCLLPPEVTPKTRSENLKWAKTQWFIGHFFGIFSLYQVLGNFLAFAVLTFDNKGSSQESVLSNTTQECGSADCYIYTEVARHNSTEMQFDVTNNWLKLVLFGIYGLMQISTLVIHLIYIQPVKCKKDSNKSPEFTRQYSLSLLGHSIRSIVHQMFAPLQILLCPLTVCSGMIMAFTYSDFTRSFISCPLGVEKVGLVMTVFGLSAIVGGFIFKWKSSAWDRNAFFVLFAVAEGSALSILSYWKASSNFWAVYIISVLFGLSESWRLSFLSATYPQYFQDNQTVALCCLSLLTSIGYVIAFSLGTNLCIFSKIILLLVFLFVSSICYVFADIYFRKKSQVLHSVEP